MRFPVFVSTPNCLSEKQQNVYKFILEQLGKLSLEPYTLGQNHRPTQSPLHEVMVMAHHVCGGVILGFEQLCVTGGWNKPGTSQETEVKTPVFFPTPWNQLEAGILYTLGVPLLILKEHSITGGIFDNGVSRWFTHTLPKAEDLEHEKEAITSIITEWRVKVSERFYSIV
ncbi:MAG: hypothetical protein R3B84_21940 [Zavarzinella sp.]